MSRESRVGLGGSIVGLALIGLVPAAQYFGLRLDDRQMAAVLIVSFVAFLAGSALLIHAGLPGHKRRSSPPLPPPPPSLRTGVKNRPTGKANLPRAKFGKDLDVGVDNEGELNAEDAEFGVTKDDPTQ